MAKAKSRTPKRLFTKDSFSIIAGGLLITGSRPKSERLRDQWIVHCLQVRIATVIKASNSIEAARRAVDVVAARVSWQAKQSMRELLALTRETQRLTRELQRANGNG